MSTFVTEQTLRVVTGSLYGAITNGMGLVAAGLLALLLTVQVVLGVFSPDARERATILDMAVWPLAFVLVLSTLLRAIQLVPR